MQDLPSAGELVEAVREFLETEIFPTLEGSRKFHTRVAVNVLGIVQRELEQSQRVDAEERERLHVLLPDRAASELSLLDLNTELAARIRAGSLDDRRQELLQHMHETLRDKLDIANPKYRAG